MKGRATDELVYEYMFPSPRETDPQNFPAFLATSLIPEVRQEVQDYYGHIDTLEAKYPGLDYCHPVHRVRLSRRPWHRRMFRAFVSLGLTDAEISRLTKWEGTKWAKERYEREHNTVIRDSEFDAMERFVPPWDRPRLVEMTMEEVQTVTLDRQEMTIEEAQRAAFDQLDEMDASGEEDEEESDGAVTSVGPILNERLREQVARREAGDSTAVLDEEWEQWLKDALETGGFPGVADAIAQGGWPDSDMLLPVLTVFPPAFLVAAREGRWEDVPEGLEPTLRRVVGAEEAATPTGEVVRSEERRGFRRYSELGLPAARERMRAADAHWG